MGYRDPRQSREFLLAELLMLALQDALRGRPTQALVRPIHFGQKHDVCRAVLLREAAPPEWLGLHFPGLHVLPRQPRDLRQAPPGGLAQIRWDRSPLFSG